MELEQTCFFCGQVFRCELEFYEDWWMRICLCQRVDGRKVFWDRDQVYQLIDMLERGSYRLWS